MSIVVLDATEGKGAMSEELKGKMAQRSEAVSYFRLSEMTILPCRSCGACGYKSPGKCVFKDDMHDIHRAIAKCNTIIMLAPVVFGGYSSTMKKAVDKFMHLCLPSYAVKYGHLLHPARYGSKTIIGIGLQQGDSKERAESFKKLVENNALNLQYEYKAIAMECTEDAVSIYYSIDDLLRRVCN